MTYDFAVQLIGYLGSALVIASLAQKSILRLRLIGLAGSAVFFVYSVLIEAYPIAVVNVIAAAIHVYYLLRLTRRPHDVFSTLRVYPESRYLDRFLEFHAADIERFQPEFHYAPQDGQFAVFILRDMVPAGLLVCAGDGSDLVEIRLDYAIPEYRDFKLGQFVFSEASGVFDPGTRIWARATTEQHANYLRRMGFERSDADRYLLRQSI
jgi:hypothetical protein